ncbi:hypothetical protein K0C01_00935 [Salinarchaeum sp. IM2453]|uniref:THUMP domain-containing protein n=1 Tax=Salinarchaeum sp. IM2453 TaxID=2862870 RepID=UPI001C82D275|nr:THUMP domain-containing protein [Salinarchaeum sp. IM2453]QZA88767.1 hypothetical protein K0C01_00935 [Salinarchaeum sp. IM2453]
MKFIGTTVPGLEEFAIQEVDDLTGQSAKRHHQGAIQFTGERTDISYINQWSRQLHRMLLILDEGNIKELEDAYEIARSVPIEEYVSAGQSFGVQATRHGEHQFTSVEVADRIGQGIVDRTRAQFNSRLPVNLDHPEIIVRAFVRHDKLIIAIDTTGEVSLHRRNWRVCEHNAPLRPTIAHSMLRLVDYQPDDRLLDPMCGGGTIPIEAAGWQTPLPVTTQETQRAYHRLSINCQHNRQAPKTEDAKSFSLTGIEKRKRWIDCARENINAAGLEEEITIKQGDGTKNLPDADIIATDLPFGIRTNEDLSRLYSKFSSALQNGSWEQFVCITTRPELLELSPTQTIRIKYGQLDATIVLKNL